MIGQADVLAQVLRGADPAKPLSALHAAEVSDMIRLTKRMTGVSNRAMTTTDRCGFRLRWLARWFARHPQADLVSVARTWLTHEGGALALRLATSRWSQARLGHPAASHYSIGGNP